MVQLNQGLIKLLKVNAVLVERSFLTDSNCSFQMIGRRKYHWSYYASTWGKDECRTGLKLSCLYHSARRSR